MRAGVRNSTSTIHNRNMPTRTAMPTNSVNTASDTSALVVPPQDSTTLPGWSATHAAPAPAAAIRARNRMMRIMKFLLGCRERGRGVGGEFARGGECRVTGIGLVEPGLRGSAIGRGQRVQFTPRFREV